MKKLIIIPAFNESQNIVPLIREIKTGNPDFDIIVINDCSEDNTLLICKQEGVSVLDLSCNLGIGGAMQTGYRYAQMNNYDIAVQMDGDGQHGPEYLDQLVKPIENGTADMVIGSRFILKQGFQSSWIRRFGIQFYSFLIHKVSRQTFTDPTSGYRAVNKEVLYYFSNHYPVDYPEPESIVSLLRLNYKVIEVPVSMRIRMSGQSSIKGYKTLYYAIKVTLAILIDLLKKEEKAVHVLKEKIDKEIHLRQVG